MAIEAGSVVVSVIPSARGFGRSLDSQIKAELKGVTDKVKVAVLGDTADAKTKIEEIKAEIASIKDGKASVEVDSTAAKVRLKELEAELARFDHKKYEAKVGVDNKGVNFAFRGISNLTTAIIGLGPAAIPAFGAIAAGLGTVGSAALAAGGAVGIWGGVMAGALANYKKDVTNLKALNKSLQTATDPAKIKKIQGQIANIKAGWSKDEKQFDVLKDKFTGAFQAMVMASGPATFGVMNKGMKVLMGIMPKMTPIINAVGKAVGGLIDDLGRFSKTKQFQSILDFFRVQGTKAITSFGHIAGNILLGIINIFKRFAPYQGKMLDGIENISKKFRKWSENMGKGGGFKKFMDYAKKYLPQVKDLFVNLVQFVGKFIKAAGPLGGIEFKGLLKFLQFLNTLPPPVLTAIAVGITAIAIGLKAIQAVTGIKGVVNEVKAFGPVMKSIMGPWGLVILGLAALAAGLIYAYKHSKTFHHIVVETWKKVKEAISVAWNKVIKPALTAFVKYMKDTVGPWIKKMWHDYVQPMFKKIGQFIVWSWNHVIKPILKALVWYFKNVLGPVYVWLWKHVIAPAFKAIGKIIVFAWNHVIKPIFTALKKFIENVLAPVIRWLWKKVVKPAFEGLGKVIVGAWKNVISPVFGKMKDGVGKVRDTFHTIVGKIKDIWGSLKDAMRGTVNWIIKNVINRLIGAVDAVASHLGKGKAWIPKLSLVGSGGSGGSFVQANDRLPTKRAQGGVLPGYTPGVDVHKFVSPTAGELHLSGGEGILIPQATKALGGERGIQAINDQFRHRQKFAKGGVVWPTTGHRISTYRGHDGVDINGPGQDYGNPIFAWRSGKITYAGWGRGYGHGIFEKAPGYPEVVYGHGSAVYVRSGQNVKAGQMIGRVGSTGNSTGPHLHFGPAHNGTYDEALALLHGAGKGGGFGSALKFALGFANPFAGGYDAVKSIAKKVKGLALGLGHIPGGDFASMVGHGLMSKLGGFAKDKITSLANFFGGGGSSPNYSGPLKRQALQALNAHGWGGQWDALNQIVSHESSWNPRAENPTSTASGLFQFIDSTARAYGLGGHAANAPVGAQLNAGMRYIGSRYHDPNGAWRFWAKHHWYDNGGIASGKGLMAKNIIKPERVLSPRQTENHERLTEVLDRMSQGKGGRTEFTITNWKTGEGYFRNVASDEVASAGEFAGTRRRML